MRILLLGLAMTAWMATATEAQPCCGPITPAGEHLALFLDDSGVTRLWLSGWHVDWRTGVPRRSAVAATKTQERVFASGVLRPPEHRQPDGAGSLRYHAHEVSWP